MIHNKLTQLILVACLSFACTPSNTISKVDKSLNIPLDAAIKGFDPLFASGSYTYQVQSQIFERLFEYHYLKRPYQLKPMLAVKMPKISADGLTYTIKLRKDVFFEANAIFGKDEQNQPKTRKLTAHDIVYTLTRFADPNIKHPSWWILQNQIVGLDELRKQLQTEKKPVNYSNYPVAGLKALNDRTLQIKLKQKNKQFLYLLAMPNVAVVAKEAVEAFGQDFVNTPVGTGPFVLDKWVRNQKIVLKKSPSFRQDFDPKYGEAEDEAKGLLLNANQRMPFVDQATFWIYPERQTVWLNFQKGNLDYAVVSKDAYDSVYSKDGKLKQSYLDKGMQQQEAFALDVIMKVFNMKDPIIGKNKALRKAISAAINRDEKINLFYNNRAYLSHGPIPKGMFGYDADLKDPNTYNVKQAQAFMKQALAFHKQQTGQDTIPPLQAFDISGSFSRQMNIAVEDDLRKINYSSKITLGTWSQFIDRMKNSDGQLFSYSWLADYPDPENFLQLLYSKNASPGPNSANFNNPQYDKLYLQMKNMDNGPKRMAIIKKMVNIIHEECPWVLFVHRKSSAVNHAWIKNRKTHAIYRAPLKYLNVDLDIKKATLPKLK